MVDQGAGAVRRFRRYAKLARVIDDESDLRGDGGNGFEWLTAFISREVKRRKIPPDVYIPCSGDYISEAIEAKFARLIQRWEAGKLSPSRVSDLLVDLDEIYDIDIGFTFFGTPYLELLHLYDGDEVEEAIRRCGTRWDLSKSMRI